ncbi:MAG: stage 0 sporulation protein [bacterium]|nr:stage 0 sporulation protein [bacterium]
MAALARVIFRKTKETAYVDPGNTCIAKGNMILIKTENVLESAKVVETDKKVNVNKKYYVERLVSATDMTVLKENEEAVSKLKYKCKDTIKKYDLKMRLTFLEYTFHRKKLFFYYTASNRVDFRALIKELSFEFSTKIQMVQIGVRDESKMLGGIGHCGRVLCCKNFLRNFKPIVIDMAKDQKISLNPAKISGACGRLLCCLEYEHSQYKEMEKDFPHIKKQVEIVGEGKGLVISRDILKEQFGVKLEDGTIIQCKVENLK